MAKQRSFHRPHKRVQYTGQLVNHITGELFTPPRRVKQAHVPECDINNILKQYSATGQIRHMSAKAAMGAYVDLPDGLDFQEAVNIVLEGEKAFSTLPSKVRDRFGNDPTAFLAFMADGSNQDEAIKLGLATKRVPPPAPSPAPVPAAPVAAPAAASEPPKAP